MSGKCVNQDFESFVGAWQKLVNSLAKFQGSEMGRWAV